ncbi:hypothetical protein [Flavobacterium hydrophilum]|uniref:FDX-ACB domain-containing protein n=1 Tax=Flavobacterium hydrophilum TaxID=2211445 RepID=A0A2V4C4T9_9FLAO|nr:hypothetical protein [Flavobacterium hydrophilum]PXY46359.1 hypothetical protein DMB68_04035 [Flavobacterium hydrophilum]
MKNDTEIVDKDYFNSAVVSGVTGNTIQINVRYWVKTELSISHHLSEIIIKVTEALKENGFTIK